MSNERLAVNKLPWRYWIGVRLVTLLMVLLMIDSAIDRELRDHVDLVSRAKTIAERCRLDCLLKLSTCPLDS